MSDSLKRYRAIKDGLKQLYPDEARGNRARHLNVLAALISGIVGSHSTQLPKIAAALPGPAKAESRSKACSRWVNAEEREHETYFLPFVQMLLAHLAQTPLVLVMDVTDIGRQCVTLMLSVVYQGRALPIFWVVYRGKKGHLPSSTHVAFLEAAQELLPVGSEVILLGDGEFDGPELLATAEQCGWHYVCRTAKNALLTADDESLTFAESHVQPGECLSWPEMQFTHHGYGPVHAIAWWRTGCEAPLYLVTNFELSAEACYWYAKRFRIETFFSDQKSRGFHLHKSHLADPMRLGRLMIASCLAYIWIVYLGVIAKLDRWDQIIHRTDRCDLSLFQLGLRLLQHFMQNDCGLPVAFQVW